MKLSKTRIIVPAAVVVLALAAGGAQLLGQHLARLRVDAALASLPDGAKGQYQSLHYNVFTRTLRLSDLVVRRDGAPIFKAAHAVIQHAHGDGSTADPFAANRVRIDGLEIWRLGHHVTLSYASGTDIALLGPGIAPPATTPLWLARPDLGTLVAAGGIKAAGMTSDNGTSIGMISASGFKDGLLQQASLHAFADRDGQRIASISASAINLDGLDRVFDTSRYQPGAPSWAAPRSLIGHLEIAGLQGTDSGTTFAVDHLSADNLAGRPFALPPTAANTGSEAFLVDAPRALSLGGASLSNLTFSDADSKFAGTLGSWTLTGYGAGKIALLSFRDLAVRSADQPALSLGQFRFADLDAAKLLDLPPDSTIDDWMHVVQTGGVSLGQWQMADFALHISPKAVVTFKTFAETLDSGMPMKSSLDLQGLTLPASLSPYFAGILSPMGLDHLMIDLQESGSFDYAKRETVIDPLVLTAEGLGRLKLSVHLLDLPLSTAGAADPEAILDRFAAMQLGAFDITFTDHSLVKRLLAVLAAESGKSVADTTTEARVTASFFAATVVPDQPDAGAQAAAFMDNPKTLTLTAAPVHPVPLTDLLGNQLRAAQAALNLRLTAQ